MLGVSGANAVAAKVGAAVAAGAALAAALGGKAGVPGWLRIVFVALALVVAIMVVVLTLFEQTAGPRARVRRRRDWVEDHFEPRGRGVARKSEPGAYFTGRTRALRELVGWLGTNRGGLCVVTGDPGSGKSAVLGRVVALVEPKRWRELGIMPAGTVPPEGSIDLTVWARGLTLGELIEEIAATIGTSATTPDELIDAVRERGRRLVVVIDALDEASGEGEARRVAQRLLKPLAAAGRSIDVKVVVGTRRGPGNELLDALGAAKQVLDLDTPDYLDRADLVQYVHRRLRREGETDARTPYRAQPALAAHVAEAVAARADPSFLIAQLVSATLADAPAVIDTSQPGWENQFAADVGSAMDDYLDRFETERDRRRARDLLTALAYAEGAGLPGDQSDNLWPLLASALAAKPYDGDDIDWVLHTAAADLVDHTMADDGSSTCRLFHQALDDHLRGPAEQQRNRQRALAGALEATVPQPEATAFTHRSCCLRGLTGVPTRVRRSTWQPARGARELPGDGRVPGRRRRLCRPARTPSANSPVVRAVGSLAARRGALHRRPPLGGGVR